MTRVILNNLWWYEIGDESDFITDFVKKQDKKSLLEQPKCAFIRAINDTPPVHSSLGGCCTHPGEALLLQLCLSISPPAVARQASLRESSFFPAGSKSGPGVWCWMLVSLGCVHSSPTSSAVSACRASNYYAFGVVYYDFRVWLRPKIRRAKTTLSQYSH